MSRIVVLGATGLLGSMVTHEAKKSNIETVGLSRQNSFSISNRSNNRDFVKLFENSGLRRGDLVVNCIGLTKDKLVQNSISNAQQAITLNSLFPLALAEYGIRAGFRVIHISTDCVFSGEVGNYVESDLTDARDLYGKTKSLADVETENMLIIRTSIVGPGPLGSSALLEWVRSRPQGMRIPGFVNHLWNGVTTRVLSRIIINLWKSGGWFSGLQHLVPSDSVTKYELVSFLARAIHRTDLEVYEHLESTALDRRLSTIYPSRNNDLFRLAGFVELPSIWQMTSKFL